MLLFVIITHDVEKSNKKFGETQKISDNGLFIKEELVFRKSPPKHD